MGKRVARKRITLMVRAEKWAELDAWVRGFAGSPKCREPGERILALAKVGLTRNDKQAAYQRAYKERKAEREPGRGAAVHPCRRCGQDLPESGQCAQVGCF